MSLRLRCPGCQATFVTSDDQAGQSVACPKCGAEQVAPPTSTAPPEANVFVPAEPKAPRKSRGKLHAALALIPILVVAGIVAWPTIRQWLDPRPKTMVEVAAYDYLDALAKGDSEAASKVGVVQDPPAIRSFRELRRDPSRNVQLKGSFAPLARLHRSIEKKFDYDQASGRFAPKDALGPAAETLDALHEAKAKAEKDDIYTKMASGDPEEAMQAAIDFGGVFSRLSTGILSPKKIIPSYRMLVQDAKPPLPDPERALALDYARHRESWDALLRRPFPTLKADGKFIFEAAEVTAEVRDQLASSGDPPTTLRLKLVRFQLDAIDTGWRVVSARRITPGLPDEPEDEEGPDPETPREPARPSPGEAKSPADLDHNATPVDIPK